MKNDKKITSNKKLLISSFVVTLSIIIFGISVTYAYFSLLFEGSLTVDNNIAATLNVSSNLTSLTDAINASQMSLISKEEIESKAKKVEFNVKNESTSNVNAKYLVKLVDFSLTKNLSSKYFKWRLVINPGLNQKVIDGNFLDDKIAPEKTSSTELASNLTKEIATNLPLNINQTDNLVFYIWLENDSADDQLYLTNGSFSAKLAIEASPVR